MLWDKKRLKNIGVGDEEIRIYFLYGCSGFGSNICVIFAYTLVWEDNSWGSNTETPSEVLVKKSNKQKTTGLIARKYNYNCTIHHCIERHH